MKMMSIYYLLFQTGRVQTGVWEKHPREKRGAWKRPKPNSFQKSFFPGPFLCPEHLWTLAVKICEKKGIPHPRLGTNRLCQTASRCQPSVTTQRHRVCSGMSTCKSSLFLGTRPFFSVFGISMPKSRWEKQAPCPRVLWKESQTSEYINATTSPFTVCFFLWTSSIWKKSWSVFQINSRVHR